MYLSFNILKVSLEFRISAPAPGPQLGSSVFRMQRGANEWSYGNWISYLHFWDNMLWVSSAINGEENWTKVITTPQLDAWCSLEVIHQLVAGEYVYNALCVKPRSKFKFDSHCFLLSPI